MSNDIAECEQLAIGQYVILDGNGYNCVHDYDKCEGHITGISHGGIDVRIRKGYNYGHTIWFKIGPKDFKVIQNSEWDI